MKIKIPALFLHKRTKVQNSTRAYSVALRFWQIILTSYLVDAAIVLSATTKIDSYSIMQSFLDYFSPMLIIFCSTISIAVCVAINRAKGTRTKGRKDSKLFKLNTKFGSGASVVKFLIPLVIISIVLLLTSSLSQTADSMFVSFGAVTIVAIALISTSLKSYLNLSDLVNKKPRNIFLQIYPDAIQRCLVVTIGSLSARIIGIIAIISYSEDRFTEIFFMLFEIISLLLLFSCKPKFTYFMNVCPTCRTQRSVALETFPKCPACYSRIFYY